MLLFLHRASRGRRSALDKDDALSMRRKGEATVKNDGTLRREETRAFIVSDSSLFGDFAKRSSFSFHARWFFQDAVPLVEPGWSINFIRIFEECRLYYSRGMKVSSVCLVAFV